MTDSNFSVLQGGAPVAVPHDFRADAFPPLPTQFEPVGAVVFFNGTPSFSKVSCQMDAGVDVRPGEFLGVWHGRRGQQKLTVIQVSDCFEQNPSEEPELANARKRLGLGTGYAQEGISTRVFRLAECETVEEFDLEEQAGDWVVVGERSPEALCRAGDAVIRLTESLTQRTVGGLDNPQDGFAVGSFFGGSGGDIVLSPDIAQMHVGIFGNPGKGKSYFSGVLVEEIHAWQIPTLILDVNGETVEAVNALGGSCITLPNKSRFGLPLSLLTSAELLTVAPNVQPGTQYAELIEAAHDKLRGEANRTDSDFGFDALIRKMEELAPALDLKQATVRTAVNRITALSKSELIGEKFDFIAELKKSGIVVLDCRYLTLGQTRLIAAAAARTLQRYGRQMAREADRPEASDEAKKWFSVLYIDEAHAVAPANENVVSTQVLYELARMGRHSRTGMILASQSPADLDRSILKRLQTRFVFALERDQLQAIGGIAADLGDELLASLPKLPRGVCAVTGTSELIRHGFVMKVRERRTPVGGATPKVFSQREKRSGDTV